MKTFTQFLLAGLLVTLSLPAQVEAQRSGVEVWAQTCGNCHLVQPPDRYTAERWGPIMSHMKLTARLTDAEADAVLQFLQGGARTTAYAEPVRDHPVWSLLGSIGIPVAPSHVVAFDPGEDFQAYCAACHGSKGEGNGPAAVALNPRPTDLTAGAFQQSRTDSQLLSAITDGKNSMPGFGSQLSAARIRTLVEYIRTLADSR